MTANFMSLALSRTMTNCTAWLTATSTIRDVVVGDHARTHRRHQRVRVLRDDRRCEFEVFAELRFPGVALTEAELDTISTYLLGEYT